MKPHRDATEAGVSGFRVSPPPPLPPPASIIWDPKFSHTTLDWGLTGEYACEGEGEEDDGWDADIFNLFF